MTTVATTSVVTGDRANSITRDPQKIDETAFNADRFASMFTCV